MTKKAARKLYYKKTIELARYNFLGYVYNISLVEAELNALRKLIN